MWSHDKLSIKDIEYAKNFYCIASDLGVAVEKSFSIDSEEKLYVYAFVVKHFGIPSASRGLVARVDADPFVPEQCGQIWDIAVENGYVPWNQASDALVCVRQEVIYWLNCFLWFGPEAQRPAWHTGENYGELWNEKFPA